MGTEINTIIDNLCARFATPVEELLVEIARMETAECILFCIVSVFLLVFGVILFKKTMNTTNEAFEILGQIIGSVSVILGVALFFCGTISLVKWVVAPRARAITWILELL